MRAFPVLPPVSRRATTGAASLDIRASVGTSTSPTSTGTKAVTGIGFQPKVVLPFGQMHNATGATTEAILSFGAMTTAAQAYVAATSRNAVTTSATHRRHSAASVIGDCYNGSVSREAGYSAFGSDGFTLNWTAVDAFERILNHIALGGADLEVSLVQCQMNGTNAAQSFAHGLSGAPTGVLFFGSLSSTIPPITATSIYLGLGAWAGSNQFCARIFSNNGVTTTATNRALATNGVLGWLNASGIQRTMAVSSVDATNVNCTYPVTTAASQDYFFMLAIRGAKCQVGTFDCNGSTSPLTIATSGITPKLFLPVFVKDGVDSVGTVLNDLGLTIGACDGTNHVSCGIGDVNGATTTNARRWQDSTKFCERNPSNGNSIFEATAAFSGESVVLTPTLNSFSNWGQGAYLCVGS